MKKSLIIIILIVVILAGVFIFRNRLNEASSPIADSSTTTSETSSPTETTTKTSPTYSYTNTEFNFAVELPGLTVTKKDQTKAPDTLFHPISFSFGDGKKNTMAVYIWKNKAEFDTLMIGSENQGKETINGIAFDKYKIIDGDITIYRYATTIGNTTYDVGVYDPKNASRFYILGK